MLRIARIKIDDIDCEGTKMKVCDIENERAKVMFSHRN